jgi:hypothetical protein
MFKLLRRLVAMSDVAPETDEGTEDVDPVDGTERAFEQHETAPAETVEAPAEESTTEDAG